MLTMFKIFSKKTDTTYSNMISEITPEEVLRQEIPAPPPPPKTKKYGVAVREIDKTYHSDGDIILSVRVNVYRYLITTIFGKSVPYWRTTLSSYEVKHSMGFGKEDTLTKKIKELLDENVKKYDKIDEQNFLAKESIKASNKLTEYR